jgi:hypothetical protein
VSRCTLCGLDFHAGNRQVIEGQGLVAPLGTVAAHFEVAALGVRVGVAALHEPVVYLE